jgi:hypothetical protein
MGNKIKHFLRFGKTSGGGFLVLPEIEGMIFGNFYDDSGEFF